LYFHKKEKKMSTDDVFLNLKNKVPKESQNGLKERLGKADETAILRLQTLKLKNPTICLMVSIFLGGLGGDSDASFPLLVATIHDQSLAHLLSVITKSVRLLKQTIQ